MTRHTLLALALVTLLAGLALIPLPARGEEESGGNLAAERGVRVEQPTGDGVHFSQGSGTYLGDGLILTAAHVVTVNPASTAVTILLDGQRLDGEVIRDGREDGLDLALIRLAPDSLPPHRRTQPQVRICNDNPAPRQPVQVAALGTVTPSATIASPITSDGQTGNWTDILATGFHAGASGGGVFDPSRACLWGVLIQELSGRAKSSGRRLDLTVFVPASRIGAFLRTPVAFAVPVH
ncbi:S1 family peptidase [Magnetospirillum fulvum]|uniref:Trypsin-like peptidase domain-containing protein n=1 Tax=Magnetospirillum fulvum TaxID=1082 RepID=A0A1H6I3E1_MAGFU|nr:serine protease [Magnetospirillum fulvum]SEH40964.1 Trypsin-like peptidase domain-containing protein [Magnetospirillum fulvum]